VHCLAKLPQRCDRRQLYMPLQHNLIVCLRQLALHIYLRIVPCMRKLKGNLESASSARSPLRSKRELRSVGAPQHRSTRRESQHPDARRRAGSPGEYEHTSTVQTTGYSVCNKLPSFVSLPHASQHFRNDRSTAEGSTACGNPLVVLSRHCKRIRAPPYLPALSSSNHNPTCIYCTLAAPS
jgi:hypothetical protein